jgi:hypothetical protein
VPYSTGPCLPTDVWSGASTCPVDLDPTSLIGRAPALPRVLWLRTPPPCKGGLRCTMCPTAPDLASLERWTPVRHVSYSSRSYLPTGYGSRAPHVLRLWILPPYREGSGAATACPVVSCGLQTSSIKKSLAYLLVQLGTHVPNARTPVFKAPDVRVIMVLQDVRVGYVVNPYKTCGHAATLPDGATGRSQAAD